VVAGFVILREAYAGFIAPKPIDAPVLGLAVSGVATTLNAIWSAVLVRQGRWSRSAALVADGKHLFADVVTSVGVIVGLSLVIVTNIDILDSVIAALVAVHVLWSGWAVIRESSGGLLDEADAGGGDRGSWPAHAPRGKSDFHRFSSRRAGRNDGRPVA
jgi:cation diffusion facilitator family transporter